MTEAVAAEREEVLQLRLSLERWLCFVLCCFSCVGSTGAVDMPKPPCREKLEIERTQEKLQVDQANRHTLLLIGFCCSSESLLC